jgi:hypothetical protein
VHTNCQTHYFHDIHELFSWLTLFINIPMLPYNKREPMDAKIIGAFLSVALYGVSDPLDMVWRSWVTIFRYPIAKVAGAGCSTQR